MTNEQTGDDGIQNISSATPHSTTTYKVLGEVSASDGVGVLGHNIATSGRAHGIKGVTDSKLNNPAGVYGEAARGSGETYGVKGLTRSPNSAANAIRGVAPQGDADGVIGIAENGGIGVGGRTDSSSQFGMLAINSADTGRAIGLKSYTDSSGDGSIGVLGKARMESGQTYGVQGITNSVETDATGVKGKALGNSGTTYGVHGVTKSSYLGGAGVRARAPNGAKAIDATAGKSNAINAATSGRSSDAVLGKSHGTGYFDSTFFITYWATGVMGKATATSGVIATRGVYGTNSSTSGIGHGVWGETWSTDPDAAAVKAYASNGATGVQATSTSGVGLEVTGADSGSPGDPLSHAAFIETNDTDNDNGILALKTGYTNDPDSFTNFLTFFNGNNTAYGSIEGDGGGGVTLNSGSADYAEFVPRMDPTEEMESADVVGVVGGSVTKWTDETDQALVISTQPIVTGNSPGQADEDRVGHEQVAFVGQVPVKVRGPVDGGDIVVPSGEHDGTGQAIAPSDFRPGDGPVVGRAWESDTNEGVTEVTVAVGLETGEILTPIVDQQHETIEQLEAETATLRRENEQLRTEMDQLRERVTGLETRVGADTAHADD